MRLFTNGVIEKRKIKDMFMKFTGVTVSKILLAFVCTCIDIRVSTFEFDFSSTSKFSLQVFRKTCVPPDYRNLFQVSKR